MTLIDIYEIRIVEPLLIGDPLLMEMSDLFSNHYGVWDNTTGRAGKRVRLSSARLKDEYINKATEVVIAQEIKSKALIGYAIAIKNKYESKKLCWVIQFVVHEAHRNKKIGKILLHTLWGESNYDAWGIVTANPYAIRALEKATHRRCSLQYIQKNQTWLRDFGSKNISYINDNTTSRINENESKVYTDFHVDISSVPQKIQEVTSDEVPWVFGNLDSGWEWFAFTFKQQDPFPLSPDEIQLMLDTSDEVTKQAYAKMDLSKHPWARHEDYEIKYRLNELPIHKNDKILDLGCGNGRHSIKLAQMGYNVTAVDYNCYNENIRKIPNLNFHQIDIRDIKKDKLPKNYNLILCLYDVIGTYADNEKNIKIIKEIYDHLAVGGYAVISVMNIGYLFAHDPICKPVNKNYNVLYTDLNAQNAMQTTGDIHDAKNIIIDSETNICYRLEQFSGTKEDLPGEFIVRDRRYKKDEICGLLSINGFEIIDSKYVKAGDWETEFNESDVKEILIICKKTEKHDSSLDQPYLNFESN